MKAKLHTLIFLVLSLSSVLSAQEFTLYLCDENVVQKDPRLYVNWNPLFSEWDVRDGVADGNYTVYWDSTAEVKYLYGTITNGKKVGIWTYYHLNEIPSHTISYSNGLINGSVVDYSYTGDTLEVNYYENGIPTHGIQWNDYYGLRDARNWPELTWTYANKISVSTYYDDHGKITEIDSHNYNTNIRHDILFDENGDPGVEYYSNMSNQSNIKTVHHEQRVSLNSPTRFTVHLQNSDEWNKLDSLPLFPHLKSVSIDWSSTTEISDDSIALLSKKLEVLSNCDSLTSMFIHIGGRVPSSVYDIRTLTHLDVSATGSIDHRISNLRNLEELKWWNWRFEKHGDTTLTIPRSFGKLKKLRSLELYLYIMRNPSKELKPLKNLPELEVLIFYYCRLHEFPESIADIKSLKVLHLLGGDGGFGVTGLTSLPETFFKMINLRAVYLPVTVPDSLFRMYRKKLPLCMFETESLCFSAETGIAMADGSTKLISQIRAGDIVLAYDFNTHKVDSSRVTHFLVHTGAEVTLLNIKTNNGLELWVTPNHPVYVGNNNFAPAACVSASSSLVHLNKTDEIAAMSVTTTSARSRTCAVVYNFGTTKGNYFANGILVHNK